MDENGDFGAENYGGVRIPMQLVIDPGMSRPVRVVKDLTGENCPVLTGGGTSITLKDGGPVFEVTMQEVADALTGLTDLYGSDDREGTYPLKWIVYKGDGDMVYEAECYTGAPLLGTFTEIGAAAPAACLRRTAKQVARVTAIRAPAFGAAPHHRAAQRTSTPPIRLIRRTQTLAGGDWWIGEAGGAAVAPSWYGSDIYGYLGGRLLYRTSGTVQCGSPACRHYDHGPTRRTRRPPRPAWR
ncbi:MAG: hypothetical protein MZV65_27790 [Chromatiales bacterium]|nr:hypothetical protein [Chromatiales bacterium]